MPSITFVTGVSTSGKTTVFERLKVDPDMAGYAVHDIDEHGVPAVGRGPWREFRVELLLHEAIGRLKDGVSTIVCGITFPHEVIWSRYYDSGLPVNFIMLRVSLQAIAVRLRARIASPEFADSFDECFNPQNEERAIVGSIEQQERIAHAVRSLRCGTVLDVSNLTIDDMYTRVAGLIEQEGGVR